MLPSMRLTKTLASSSLHRPVNVSAAAASAHGYHSSAASLWLKQQSAQQQPPHLAAAAVSQAEARLLLRRPFASGSGGDGKSAAAGGPATGEKPTVAMSAKSIVNSILRGSTAPDGSKAEELHTTYSKLMARGKYVHELQVHNVKPEAMEDYTGLVREHYSRIANDPQFLVKLFGSWTVEIGDVDQAIHIWEYNHYPGYIKTHEHLAMDVQYQAFLRKLRPMLRSRENQIMLEFAFWQAAAPITTGGIYELRTYLLKPGKMLEWEQQWKRGLEARRKFVQPIGAWFSQLGELNYVHHMWGYPDLQVRKEMREKAWELEEWTQTAHKTVALIDKMQARIMRPLDFSPVK